MIKYDYHIAVVAFIVALLLAPLAYWIGIWALVPEIGWLGLAGVAATTINLLQQRSINYSAGEKFSRHVHKVLDDDIEAFEERMRLMVKDIEDIKESQVKIAGSFRGRNLP